MLPALATGGRACPGHKLGFRSWGLATQGSGGVSVL